VWHGNRMVRWLVAPREGWTGLMAMPPGRVERAPCRPCQLPFGVEICCWIYLARYGEIRTADGGLGFEPAFGSGRQGVDTGERPSGGEARRSAAAVAMHMRSQTDIRRQPAQ